LDQAEYNQQVKQLSKITGKRIADKVYVHWDVIKKYGPLFGIHLHDYLKGIADEYQLGHDWNVVKLSTKKHSVSFLYYPAFYKKFHPALKVATTIGIDAGKSKTTNYRVNRPILHRCETMMIPNSALQAHFCNMTTLQNANGLYEDVKIIGREDKWNALLKSKNMLEFVINAQNEIAKMVRRSPELPTLIIPDAVE